MLALAFGATPEHIGLRYHRVKISTINVPPK
jgi:hypothetical protein